MYPDFYVDDADMFREIPTAQGYGFYPGFPPGYMMPIMNPALQQTPSFATTPLETPGPQFVQAPATPSELDIEYTQGYLKTQIGKRVKIFFLIGTNIVQDREGILKKVGISYIILKEADTNIDVLCDIYSIKFVTIY